MSPAFEVGDIVLVDEIEIEDIQEGDIIQYVGFDNSTVLHRVVDIYEENGETLFSTKGDANPSPDFNPITSNRILGKVVFTIPKLGWIQIYFKSLLQQIGIPIK